MDQNAKMQSYVSTAWDGRARECKPEPQNYLGARAWLLYPQEPSPKGRVCGLGSGPYSVRVSVSCH